MPMLERTAASLEPCHLQRVLPPKKTPFKSSRRLHTAFWQHGAADIELSKIWQALMREPLENFNLFPTSRSQSSSNSRNESWNASSTFLLDFLYPQGATSILRKLSPSILDRYERPRLYLRGTVPRLFSSSASLSQQSRDLAEDSAANAVTGHASAQDEAGSRAEDAPESNVNETSTLADRHSAHEEVASPEELMRKAGGDKLDAISGDASAHEATAQIDEMPKFGNVGPNEVHVEKESQICVQTQLDASAGESLRDLLNMKNGSEFERIWFIFHAYDRAEDFRSQFIDYVTEHRSMTYLLAKSLKEGRWQTLRLIWTRHPEAHREGEDEDEEAINWKEFERHANSKKMVQKLLPFIEDIQSSEDIVMPGANLKLNETLLSRLVYPIIRRYHQKLDSQDYMRLPVLLKDPLLYELFLGYTTVLPRLRELSDKLYKAYREVPGVKIRGHVMRAMVHHVYQPVRNDEGMKLVLQDLRGRFPRLDTGLYRAYIKFFARRGDIRNAQRYFDEYRLHYPEERKVKQVPPPPYPDFFYLLQLYAIRGELSETRRIFSQAQADFGPRLDTTCWNVLLNAHAKAREYDAAVRVFGLLKHAVTADQYSYGTMMGMSGSRGDLEFTLELYRMAKSENIEPNVTMVDCVVEAYCQNDRFNDAENIVKITTERKRFNKKELTILWNSLLWHYAMRRDLKTLNETLNKMTEYGIPYDGETYSQLLRALAWCRQPHHALFLLQQAVKKRVFQPTSEHYTLLMSAFIITGQPEEVLRTSAILRNLGMPRSGGLLVRVLQALSAMTIKTRASNPDQSRKYLVSALRQFRESIEQTENATENLPQRTLKGKGSWNHDKPKATTVAMRTEHTNILIHTFTLMRKATDVKGVIELWESSSPESTNLQEPPIRLLHSLMLSAFYEGNHDEVRQTWRMIFDRAIQSSYVSAPGTERKEPLPALRYMLNDPLKTMQRLHGVTNDPDGLRETIISVLSAGFRLDSKNWNFYVQLLADLKRWREAFIVCEEQLMPYWRGWARVRAKTKGVMKKIPLEVRRRYMNPHKPRPISYTLMVLSKAYMDLEQMASWSGEAERLLAYIEYKCPMSVAAVRSAVRTNQPLEKKILSQGKPRDSRNKSDLEIQQAREEKQKRREARRKSRDETEMPQSFQEMMEEIVSSETGIHHPQYWNMEDESQPEGESRGTSATVNTSITDVEQEDGRSDANDDEDRENRTPKYPEQILAISKELQDAEAAIFSGMMGRDSSEEAEKGVGGSKLLALQNADLKNHIQQAKEESSMARAGKDSNGRVSHDHEEHLAKDALGENDKEKSEDQE